MPMLSLYMHTFNHRKGTRICILLVLSISSLKGQGVTSTCIVRACAVEFHATHSAGTIATTTYMHPIFVYEIYTPHYLNIYFYDDIH